MQPGPAGEAHGGCISCHSDKATNPRGRVHCCERWLRLSERTKSKHIKSAALACQASDLHVHDYLCLAMRRPIGWQPCWVHRGTSRATRGVEIHVFTMMAQLVLVLEKCSSLTAPSVPVSTISILPYETMSLLRKPASRRSECYRSIPHASFSSPRSSWAGTIRRVLVWPIPPRQPWTQMTASP